jgi:uncharacterized protein YciI
MEQFLYQLRPTRPAMLVEGLTEREESIVGEHFAYLQGLVSEGVVLMAGRTQTTGEDTFGIVVYRSESEKAARGIMEADPAVANGVMTARLYPFGVALWSERGLTA